MKFNNTQGASFLSPLSNVLEIARAQACDVGRMHYNSIMCDIGCLHYRAIMNLNWPIAACTTRYSLSILLCGITGMKQNIMLFIFFKTVCTFFSWNVWTAIRASFNLIRLVIAYSKLCSYFPTNNILYYL